MITLAWIFRFRWILWTWGILRLLGLATKSRPRRAPRWAPAALFGGFFLLSALAKLSQLRALALNPQDFWLFVDLLDQAREGGFFLTRFAPQAQGWVQHAAVHLFAPWALLVPLASAFGATWVALFFNPAALTWAAYLLYRLSYKRWGGADALVFATAFLASTQVGKILMYETHPEALYPALFFLWAWGLGLDGTGRVRWIALLGATVTGILLKEDSIFVFLPAMAWTVYAQRGTQRRAALAVGTLALGLWLFQVYALKQFGAGTWGHGAWKGDPVILPATTWRLGAAVWEGGMSGALSRLGSFLISRGWLEFLVLAPWIVLERRFWIWVLPLAAVVSQLEGPNHLWNYYSAAFLGIVWICACAPDRLKARTPKLATYSLLSALLLGAGGMEFYFPSSEGAALRAEVRDLAPTLRGRGFVSGALLGEVDRARVWSDRPPQTDAGWNALDFALFSTRLARFELSSERAQAIDSELQHRAGWMRVKADPKTGLVLYVHPVVEK